MQHPTIALLTDFGTADIYVGVMKGVMLGICPSAHLVDITHAIQPQSVRQAAFALMNSTRYFPAGTIFLVVVDPGVGSARRPIGLQAGGQFFVAPDNGVLSYALHGRADKHIVELTNPAYHLPELSNTFHARDVFAPAAAHLAAGVALDALGTRLDNMMVVPAPVLSIQGGRIMGEVVQIDHFGNLITSVGELRWSAPERLTLFARLGDKLPHAHIPTDEVTLRIGGQSLHTIHHTYSETERGALLALVGSSGYLEIAVNQGNAAARLDVAVGDPVEIQI